MARARNGNAIQSKIQMTIYGEPFTGKSTMASQFAYMKNPDGSPFKVLYLDPESGSILVSFIQLLLVQKRDVFCWQIPKHSFAASTQTRVLHGKHGSVKCHIETSKNIFKSGQICLHFNLSVDIIYLSSTKVYSTNKRCMIY